MKRYLIEDLKCDVTDGGIACGPVEGSIVATIKFNDGKGSKWLSIVETMGIPNVFLLDEDVHAKIVEEDVEDEEFNNYMEKHYIQDFEGISFGEDYDVTFESMDEDPDNPAIPLIKYLIALVRCDMNNEERLLDEAKGKFADELDIPFIDVEEDYIEEQEVNILQF